MVFPELLPVLVPPLVTLLSPVLPVTLWFPLLVLNVHLIVMSVPLPMLVLLALHNTFGILVPQLAKPVMLSVTNVLLLLTIVLLAQLLYKQLLLLPMVNQSNLISLKLPPIPSVLLVVVLPPLPVFVVLVLMVIVYLLPSVLNVMLLVLPVLVPLQMTV